MARHMAVAAVAALLVATVVAFRVGMSSREPEPVATRQPLYWVAPMDPTYRRDGPGKSPMGMDLVPVYADVPGVAGEVRISPAMEQNIGVRTAPVREGMLTDTITTVGYVTVNEARLWHAYPRVEGWIDRLNVAFAGESVKPGEALFEIYSPMLVAAQQEYVSALEGGNRALIASAEARLRTLDLPEAALARIAAKRAVERTMTVVSPMAGIVSNLGVRAGHYVGPGTSVLDVAGLEDVWVIVRLFESDAPLVENGDAMHLRFDALGGETLHTHIDFVSPVFEPATRTLVVRGTLANADGRLRPDMFAEARIDVSHEGTTLLVPRQALIRTGRGDRVVLMTAPGRYRSVAVETGRTGDREVEVRAGLRRGDLVVTSAQFLIDSESSVDAELERMDLDDGRGADEPGFGAQEHGAMNHDHGGAPDTGADPRAPDRPGDSGDAHAGHHAP